MNSNMKTKLLAGVFLVAAVVSLHAQTYNALWIPPTLPADGKVRAQVTFSKPGTYVLRAHADDGALTGDQDVTVTVTP